MNQLVKTSIDNFGLSKEEVAFLNEPKSSFKIKLKLTPYEYFALAQFSISRGLQIVQTIDNNLTIYISDAELAIVDLSKTFTNHEMAKWLHKSTTREHTYSMTIMQAVIVCKMMQKYPIDYQANRVLGKIFKALINTGLGTEFLTVKIEN